MRIFTLFQNIFPFRPFRMYRRGRPVVNHFRVNEQLYRRHRRRDIQDGVFVGAVLQFPKNGDNTGQSVNRSAFSRPEDALWTDNGRLHGWGVFQFPVSCLPEKSVCAATGRQFTFFPKHVPLKNNFAHSEIWCDQLPRKNAEYVLPTRFVRKELRARIQKHSRIVIEAEL